MKRLHCVHKKKATHLHPSNLPSRSSPCRSQVTIVYPLALVVELQPDAMPGMLSASARIGCTNINDNANRPAAAPPQATRCAALRELLKSHERSSAAATCVLPARGDVGRTARFSTFFGEVVTGYREEAAKGRNAAVRCILFAVGNRNDGERA